jgi:YesN/AraC family two-component response regulator
MSAEKRFDLAILYVEDDASTREEVREILRDRAREVHVAQNGAEGLELFRRHAPDLVVTDIRMPVMDGLQMARAIRAQGSDVPVIVTTAYSDASFLLDAIDIGIDQYVMKPIAMRKLTAAIEKCATIIENAEAVKRHHEERERLIGELQAALARVKLLSGLLPICSSCKKIRDNKGSWKQMEVFISDHSETEFTHGYCPECAAKELNKLKEYQKTVKPDKK